MIADQIIKPKDDIVVAKPWTGVPNPLANTDQPYLRFVNSGVFQEDGRRFLKYGYYTNAPFGSKDYNDYWDEQEKRVLNGYSVGGIRVTGRHYFYLNFCLIKARPIDPNTGAEKTGENRKIITLPRFLDHNYYWFNEFEKNAAEGIYSGNQKRGMIIAKSRRKGFTYQVTGGVYGYNFNFIPASMNILAAYEKGHYKVTLDGIHFTINHVNKATDWGKKQNKLSKRDHFRASFVMKNQSTGVEIEDGYMSEIQAVSFKDNPFKSIGESTDLMGFEEAGKFEHLLTAYTISEPTFRDGDIMTGVPLIWGTGGDMEKGTRDFAEMYYDPEPYGLASYENIYDENATGDCGWFIDDMWYYPGSVKKIHYVTDKYGKEIQKEEELPFVDEQGNSHRILAEESLDEKREKRRRGSRSAYNKFITQQPKTPAEAFLRVQGTMFDTIRASARLSQILTNKKTYVDSIWLADLVLDPDNQKIKFQYNTTGIPLRDFPIKDNKQEGVIEIYEMPLVMENEDVPFGRYIAGIDPYDDDESTTRSVGSIIVLDLVTDRIVCHYKGRPSANKFFETCRRILKFYNATANYERNKKGLYGYLYNKGQLHLLCDEPEILRDRGISKANTFGNNAKGTNASPAVNLYGLQRSVAWMEEKAYGKDTYDDQGNLIESELTNLDEIRSIPLLQEIIGWNPDDNFDDISALGMLMIYREDRLRLKGKLRQKEIKTLAEDDFFNRHVGGHKSYSNRKIMDFIKTENKKDY
jgi:hypothetical protein